MTQYPLPRIALIDDSQGVALASADWKRLAGRAEIAVISEPFTDEDAAANALRDFDIVVPMRERTAFPATLVRRLPKLRLFAMTGPRAGTFDIPAFTANGTLVCNTGSLHSGPSTAELAFALILATARFVPQGDAAIRAGRWHQGVPMGGMLEGKRLGIVGLGRIGAKVAHFGQAFGMEVVAWSSNLTPEKAGAAGATLREKHELFATSDVISLHLVLSERTRGIVGAKEIAAMKPGATFINTARAPLVDAAALLAGLQSGRINAGLDVFEKEPLPADDPLAALPNVVLTPHLGYSTGPGMRQFYGEVLENIEAFLDGHPTRIVNPDVLAKP